MKKTALLYLFVLGTVLNLVAQEKKIALEEIWGGEFRTQGLDALRSMQDGKSYTVLNFDRATNSSSVDRYDYESQQKTETIVSSANIAELPYFTSYSFSEDESKLIFGYRNRTGVPPFSLGNLFRL